METRILKVNARRPELKKIREAASIIRRGGLVAFPTETVYGLGANALDPRAVKRIFTAKGRPTDNPMIVHIATISDAKKIVKEFTPEAKKLAKTFWPGPLTLVLKKSPSVPDSVTAGLDTVAVRMPDHNIAFALIRQSGTPIAAPSANLSGRPSPTKAEHVLHDLSGRIDALLDGGNARIGVESTVLDLTREPATILRPGGVTLKDIRKTIGKAEIHHPKQGETPRSPGMKYRHYAPKGRLILLDGPAKEVRKRIRALIRHYICCGESVGVISTGRQAYGPAARTKYAGRGCKEYASNLYRLLRELDEEGADIILAEGVGEAGLGSAVMNRLRRASHETINC
jgi:L-threonylcarbamoyladenylate synthase